MKVKSKSKPIPDRSAKRQSAGPTKNISVDLESTSSAGRENKAEPIPSGTIDALPESDVQVQTDNLTLKVKPGALVVGRIRDAHPTGTSGPKDDDPRPAPTDVDAFPRSGYYSVQLAPRVFGLLCATHLSDLKSSSTDRKFESDIDYDEEAGDENEVRVTRKEGDSRLADKGRAVRAPRGFVKCRVLLPYTERHPVVPERFKNSIFLSMRPSLVEIGVDGEEDQVKDSENGEKRKKKMKMKKVMKEKESSQNVKGSSFINRKNDTEEKDDFEEGVSDVVKKALREEYLEATSLPSAGETKYGVIVNITVHGLFVRLTRHVTGLVQHRMLDPFAKYTPGEVVAVKVLKVDQQGHKLFCQLVNYSHSTMSISKNGKNFVKPEVGMKCAAIVTNCEAYGVFVCFCEPFSHFGDALCYKRDIKDEKDGEVNNASNLFDKGDKVLVKILKIDDETGKISVGMKPSLFSSKDISEIHEREFGNISKANEDAVENSEDKNSNNEGETDNESHNENDLSSNALNILHSKNSESEFDDDDDDVGEDDQNKNEDDIEGLKGAKRKDSVENNSEYTDREATAKKRKLDSSKSNANTDDLDKEFRRQLVTDPNSSLIWIRYISQLLDKGNISKAKEMAKKAIETINFREIEEKKNVFIVYLKLLLKFEPENDDEFDEVFERFSKLFDKKESYMLLSDIYIENGHFKKADDAAKSANKSKKQQSRNCWIKRIELRFSESHKLSNDKYINEARENLLKDAISNLPKEKQPRFLMDFARLEFNTEKYSFASPERARTICENLISTFTKRTDIWHQFIDAEIKFSLEPLLNDKLSRTKKVYAVTVNRIRRLFERVVDVKMSAKKMKAFFKKWLEFEKQYGTEREQDTVKQKARDFVSKISA